MKNELAATIGTAIIGALIAFFVTNIFIGDIEPVDVKTIDSNISTGLSEPDAEVFNYKAINPTVEVYVGNDSEQGDS